MDASSDAGRKVGAEFEQLFAQHGGFAARVLRRFGVAPSDVPDASQEVFLVVLRRLPEFEARGSHRTWLYRICACVAADYRKRAHRRYERVGDEAESTAVAHDQETRASGHELLARLEHALDRLPDEQRQVFVLYDLEDQGMARIAELLGCPLKTAFSRLYAARREIRAELARAGYASMAWTLIAPRPWSAHAAPALRAAMDVWGIPATGSSALAISGGALVSFGLGALPIAALAVAAFTVTPSETEAIAIADGRTVTVVPESESVPKTEPIHDSNSHSVSKSKSDSDNVPEPVPEPVPDPTPTKHSTPRAPRHPARSPSSTPPSSASSDWIHAPEPVRSAPPAPAPPRASVGLDEVLSATSIDSLTRFTPPQGPRRPIALVPARGRASTSAARSDR